VRPTAWPLFKRVPDIGGEVARSIGHFLDQPGNQQVIDELLERGVRIGDTHPPSPKLAEGLDAATLLADLEIPKVTANRAERLLAAFASPEALAPAPAHQVWTAGLPAGAAGSLQAWMADEATRALYVRALEAQRKLLEEWPKAEEAKAGSLDGQTVVLTGPLESMTRDEAKDRREALGAKA